MEKKQANRRKGKILELTINRITISWRMEPRLEWDFHRKRLIFFPSFFFFFSLLFFPSFWISGTEFSRCCTEDIVEWFGDAGKPSARLLLSFTRSIIAEESHSIGFLAQSQNPSGPQIVASYFPDIRLLACPDGFLLNPSVGSPCQLITGDVSVWLTFSFRSEAIHSFW